MDFVKERYGNIIIETVNLYRATIQKAIDFRKVLEKDIDEGGRFIIADLSRCEFIDSTFLGALVVSLKKAAAIGGDLKLVGFQHPVQAMFELTRLFSVFEVYATREEALDSFKKVKN